MKEATKPAASSSHLDMISQPSPIFWHSSGRRAPSGCRFQILGAMSPMLSSASTAGRGGPAFPPPALLAVPRRTRKFDGNGAESRSSLHRRRSRVRAALPPHRIWANGMRFREGRVGAGQGLGADVVLPHPAQARPTERKILRPARRCQRCPPDRGRTSSYFSESPERSRVRANRPRVGGGDKGSEGNGNRLTNGSRQNQPDRNTEGQRRSGQDLRGIVAG